MYNTTKISAVSVMDSDIVWGIREGFFVKMEFHCSLENELALTKQRDKVKEKVYLDKGKDKSECP